MEQRDNLPEPGPIALSPGMFTDKVRDMICTSCGETFVQRQLSPAFKKWVSAFGSHLEQLWNSRVPDDALPIYCLKCERHSLGDRNRPPVKPSRLGGYVE